MSAPRLVSIADFKKAPAPEAHLRKQYAVEVRAEGEGAPVEFTISTATVDRSDDTVSVAGWKLDNYRKNPVVLWAHDRESPPVAKAVWVEAKDGALKSAAEFTPRDLYPFGHMVGQMYRAGFLRAVSVGFQPLKWIFNEERSQFGIDFLEQELLEYSPVPVPANPEALVSAKAAGIDTAPLIEWAEKTLDGAHGAGLWLPRSAVEAAWKAAKGGARIVSLPTKAEPDAGSEHEPDEPDPMDAVCKRLEAACDRLEKACARVEESAPKAAPPPVTPESAPATDATDLAKFIAGEVRNQITNLRR